MATPKKEKPSLPEDTRERLLKVASLLFYEKGYEATSVKDLADMAGVNVSLVSYHFGGKENLYKAVLEQFGKERLAVGMRMLQPPQTAEEFRLRLGMYVEEVWTCHVNNREICQILHREVDRGFSVAEDIFKSTFIRLFESLVAFFKVAQDRGILRDDVDPLLVASLFQGNVIQIARNDALAEKYFKKTIKDPKYRASVLEHIMTGLMEGFSTRERAK